MVNAVRHYWGWVITAATFFHFFANYGFLYSCGQLLVIFQEEFGKGATLTGWIGTIPFGLTYLASPISNSLISRYQHRSIAIIGVIVCFISLIVTSFMTSLLPIFFTFSLLYGLGINFVTVAGLNIILKYFPERNSARAVTIALIGCNAGLLTVNPLFYSLNIHLGWRNTLRIAAAAVLATGLGTASTYTLPSHIPSHQVETKSVEFKLLRKTGTQRRDQKDASSDSAIKEASGNLYSSLPNTEKQRRDDITQNNYHQTHTHKRDAQTYSRLNPGSREPRDKNEGTDDRDIEVTVDLLREKVVREVRCRGKEEPKAMAVLRYPELWLIALSFVVCSAAVSFFYMSLVSFLVSRGMSDETSAIVMTALGVSQVAGKIMVALVGDYLPFPKIFTIVIANLIGAIQMGSLLVAWTILPIVAIVCISGLLVISVLDTIPHAISHQVFHPNQCLVSWTVITSSMGTGYVVGALLGESMDRTGSYDAALYVCMGFFLSSALLCSLVPVYQVFLAPERAIVLNSPSEVNGVCGGKDGEKDAIEVMAQTP